MRVGRGFGHVVVAHQGEHAAMLRRCRRGWRGGTRRRSGRRRGPCRTRREKTPSCLPSPSSSVCCEPQQAVAASSSLRPGWKTMSRPASCFLAPPQLLVEPAERRAAIAGDEARRVEAGQPVALALHQQHAHDRLRAGQEDALLAEIELVVERDVVQRHRLVLCGSRTDFVRLTLGRFVTVFLRFRAASNENRTHPAMRNRAIGRPRWRATTVAGSLATALLADPMADSAGLARRSGPGILIRLPACRRDGRPGRD